MEGSFGKVPDQVQDEIDRFPASIDGATLSP